jgi:4-amino-4-deoxy-L-arabinose transferase-like glycosyltransferase
VFFTPLRQGDLQGDAPMYAWFGYRMYATGDFLDIYYDWDGKLPYFKKPPLQFWLSALVYPVTGATVTGARLVPALFYVAAALLLYRLVRLQYPRRIAATAAMIFCLQRELVVNVMEVRLDPGMIFAFLLASYAATALLRGHAPSAPAASRGATWIGFLTIGAAVGIAVLTRGGIGLLALPVLAVAFASAGRRDLMRSPGPVLAMLGATLAIAAPWFVREYFVWGDQFKNTIQTEAAAQHLSNDARTWAQILPYYFRRLPESYALWLAPAVLGAVALWRRSRPRPTRGHDGGQGARPPRRPLGPVDRLAVAWVVVWFVLIQCTTRRSIRYTLPMFPWLSLLGAVGIFSLAAARRVWRRWVLPYAGAAAVLVSALIFALDVPLYRARDAEWLRAAPGIRAAVARARRATPAAPRPTVFLLDGPEPDDAGAQKRCAIQFYTGCRTEPVAAPQLASLPRDSYLAVFFGRPLFPGEPDRARVVPQERRDAILIDAGKRYLIYRIP